MMNQEETDLDPSIPAEAEKQPDAKELDFRKIIDPLSEHCNDKKKRDLAVGENLEKVKTTVIEKAGEVKTTIVEKAVEVRKSIDHMLHKEAGQDGESNNNRNLESNPDEHEHKPTMGEKLESVKTAVAHKAESVRTSLVVTAEELQNSFSQIFHSNNNNNNSNHVQEGQQEERDKAVEEKERGTDEASLDSNENSKNNKIGAACSWIVHKVDDLVERVQAHDKDQQLREGETTRRLSRDLVEIISQEPGADEPVVKEGQEETTKAMTFEEKVDQTRSVSSDHA